MDGDQEEMQNLGFFAIFKESFKIINSCKKLFFQITLLFIFPLTLIFLGHWPISRLLFGKIMEREYRDGNYRYDNEHAISNAWIHYWLFKAAYMTLLLIFSLLATAAVVYTIACIYTDQTVHFKKVLKVVPKVWKRLIVTFLCMFFAFFIYNAIFGVVWFIWGTSIGYSTFGFVVMWILLVLYYIGFIYMTIIWQIASVVTVLESHSGFRALIKAKDLIKGKKWKAFGVFFTLNCVFVGTIIVYFIFVQFEERVGMLNILLSIVCLLILLGVFLYGFVIQTVVYLVCKSYHHEIIDKLKLSDQLDGYLGEFEPIFKANKDVQLGQTQGGGGQVAGGQAQGGTLGPYQV